MKNIELLAKAKKEGYNKLTPYELSRLSVMAWREDSFSLNGIINHMQRTNEPAINALLEKTGLKKDVITVAWVLKHCDKNKLVKHRKNEAGKLIPTEEKKVFFSLGIITGTINRFYAEVQAKAQSSQPKVQVKELTELEKTEDEAKKAAAKVEQNKKRNAEAKKQQTVVISEKNVEQTEQLKKAG